MPFNAKALHGMLLNVAFTVLAVSNRLKDDARTATTEVVAELEKKAKDKIRAELTKLIELLEKE
jgi:BMFP domain-containing protein YqiC